MPVAPFKDKHPKIADGVFIAPTAWVIGDVTIEEGASVFFGAVLRGDINPIYIGARTNVQENALLHTSRGLGPCRVGSEVTIGHGAILHGCEVRDRALVGMGSVVLDNAVVHEDALVGAQSMVPMGKEIPQNMVAIGSPATVKREVNAKEREFITTGVAHYIETSEWYAKNL